MKYTIDIFTGRVSPPGVLGFTVTVPVTVCPCAPADAAEPLEKVCEWLPAPAVFILIVWMGE